MSFLSLHTLSKSFHTQNVLHDINLEVLPGEFICVLGQSGSGKTTLLRLIAGFETVDHGTITLNSGSDHAIMLSSPHTHIPPEKRDMGVVFQDHALWPHMTVFDNVAFPLRAQKKSTSMIQTQVAQGLQDVSMHALAHAYPHQLSGGESQRVALARTLVQNPSMILFDEPLASLDTNLRYDLQGLIKRLHRERNFTALYITHDVSEAMRLADRVAVMKAGHILQYDTPRALYEHPTCTGVASFFGMSSFLPLKAYNDHHYSYEDYGVCMNADRTLKRISIHPQSSDSSKRTLRLRPEDISLDFTQPSTGHTLTLPCTVQECFFISGMYEITVHIQTSCDVLRTRTHTPFDVGSICQCTIHTGTII